MNTKQGHRPGGDPRGGQFTGIVYQEPDDIDLSAGWSDEFMDAYERDIASYDDVRSNLERSLAGDPLGVGAPSGPLF